MRKMLERKKKEVDDFVADMNYSSTPILVDLLDKHCLFFDSEVKVLMKLLKTANDVIKRIYKRFERRESIQIAPSVARYVELDEELSRFPHLLYNFTSHNVRICICKIKGKYHILCVNYKPDVNRLSNAYLKPFCDDDRFYGTWEIFSNEIVQFWLDIVFQYCSRVLEVIF